MSSGVRKLKTLVIGLIRVCSKSLYKIKKKDKKCKYWSNIFLKYKNGFWGNFIPD